MVDFSPLFNVYFPVTSLSPSTITSMSAVIEDSLKVISSPTLNFLPLI
jgi:hypothetical protein